MAEARGEAVRSARLHGAAEAAYQRAGPRPHSEQPFPTAPADPRTDTLPHSDAELLAAARARLTAPDLAAAWDVGHAMALDAVVGIAEDVAGGADEP